MPRTRMAELGVIPKEAAKAIWAKGKNADLRRRPHRRDRARDQARRHRLPDPSRRNRRPRGALRASGHDLLRRARHLPQRPAHARRRHPDRRRRPLLAALKKRAFEHKMTPTIGRSHGIHAEPATFGLKLAYAYAEFTRAARAPGRWRARKSRPAPSPARSAPSPISIRASKSMSPKAWASRPSRSRPR